MVVAGVGVGVACAERKACLGLVTWEYGVEDLGFRV